MSYSRARRSVAALSIFALLAGIGGVTAAPSIVPTCDYTLGAGETLAVLEAGEVACGGPGAQSVTTMNGGVFYGRGGDDVVATQNDGKFVGGGGDDSVGTQNGGVFKGLDGDDRISTQYGTFHGGPGSDRVGDLYAGARFNGGLGRDKVTGFQYGGEFIGGRGSDRVRELQGGRYEGGRGKDRAGAVMGGVFLGGDAADFARYVIGPGKFKGGPGPDTAQEVGWNAVVFGAGGNDRISVMLYGSSTYYGGAGYDSAVVCRYTANKMVAVEKKVWVTCF